MIGLIVALVVIVQRANAHEVERANLETQRRLAQPAQPTVLVIGAQGQPQYQAPYSDPYAMYRAQPPQIEAGNGKGYRVIGED